MIILFYNLCLLNQGNEPTFIIKIGKEVIDITVWNNTCFPFIKDWRVSSEITPSDNCLINFSIAGTTVIVHDYRNPRKTDWGSYITEVEDMSSRAFGKFSYIVDLELAVDELQEAILQSYYRSCKTTITNLPRLVPWWSKEISRLHGNCRKLFNRAKRCGGPRILTLR